MWACPVCAAKISERRRLEVESAFEKHKEQGGAFSFGETISAEQANYDANFTYSMGKEVLVPIAPNSRWLQVGCDCGD